MRGRALVVTWRDEDTVEALKAAYLAEREGEVRTRLHALWLARSGWPLVGVARALGAHYRSVQRWLAWYRAGGLAAVRARHKGGVGQPCRLTPDARREVHAEVASGRFRTAGEVRAWIAARYEVDYTRAGVYSLLGRLGCGPKVPRPLHAKADLAAQEAWKRGASAKRSLPAA